MNNFNLGEYTTLLHTYDLQQLLHSLETGWEGRNNIDRQELAINLSFISFAQRSGYLNLIQVITPTLLFRRWKAEQDKSHSEEIIKLDVIKMCAEMLMVEENFPCDITVFSLSSPDTPHQYLTVERFLEDTTREKRWLDIGRIIIKRKGNRGKGISTLDYDSRWITEKLTEQWMKKKN